MVTCEEERSEAEHVVSVTTTNQLISASPAFLESRDHHGTLLQSRHRQTGTDINDNLIADINLLGGGGVSS